MNDICAGHTGICAKQMDKTYVGLMGKTGHIGTHICKNLGHGSHQTPELCRIITTYVIHSIAYVTPC